MGVERLLGVLNGFCGCETNGRKATSTPASFAKPNSKGCATRNYPPRKKRYSTFAVTGLIVIYSVVIGASSRWCQNVSFGGRPKSTELSPMMSLQNIFIPQHAV